MTRKTPTMRALEHTVRRLQERLRMVTTLLYHSSWNSEVRAERKGG